MFSAGVLTDGLMPVCAVPCLGVAIVSNLYINFVQPGRQHRETTGDVCGRPLHNDTLLSAYKHHAVIVSSSQIGTLDGEYLMSYTRRDTSTHLFHDKASAIQLPR